MMRAEPVRVGRTGAPVLAAAPGGVRSRRRRVGRDVPPGWSRSDLDAYIAAHQEELGERLASALPRVALPAVRLQPRKARDEQLPVGSSKLGGCPDRAAGEAWPVTTGEPLAFLAQLNLADLVSHEPDSVLPHHGGDRRPRRR